MTVAIRRRLPPPSAVFGSQEDGAKANVTPNEASSRAASLDDIDDGEDFEEGVSPDVRRSRLLSSPPAQVVALCCEVAASNTANVKSKLSDKLNSETLNDESSNAAVTPEHDRSGKTLASVSAETRNSPAVVEPETSTPSVNAGGTKRNRPSSPSFSLDESVSILSSPLCSDEADERAEDVEDDHDDTVVTTSEDDNSRSHDGESGSESEGNFSDESSVNSDEEEQSSYLPRASKRLRRRNSVGRRRFVKFALPIVTAVFTRPKLCSTEEKCACHYTFDEMDEFRAQYYRWQERRREMGCEHDDFFEDDNEDEEDGSYFDNDQTEAEEHNISTDGSDVALDGSNDDSNGNSFGSTPQKKCYDEQTDSHVIQDDGSILDEQISTQEDLDEKDTEGIELENECDSPHDYGTDHAILDQNNSRLFELDSPVSNNDNHRLTDIISKVTVLHNEDVTEYSSEKDKTLQEKTLGKCDDDNCSMDEEKGMGNSENGFFFDTEAFWNGTIMYY